MENKLLVTSSPHIRSKFTTQAIMRDVVIALLPAAAYGIYLFGWRAAVILLLSIASAVATEAACQKIRGQAITINDFSAVVTGLLLGMNVPSSVPFYVPIIGSVFAIAIVKQVFGGLGHNFMNPALAARAFLMASWPMQMTSFPAPLTADMTAQATPLAQMKMAFSAGAPVEVTNMTDILIGRVGGCIGETSALLLLLGGIYLLARGVIRIKMPAIIIATSFVLSFLFSGFNIEMTVAQTLSGGLFLGAIFMATDYASSPVNPNAQIVYSLGIGLLIAIIRFYGSYPEGVSYSILIMNGAAPLIDRFMAPRVFGKSKGGAKK